MMYARAVIPNAGTVFAWSLHLKRDGVVCALDKACEGCKALSGVQEQIKLLRKHSKGLCVCTVVQML